jgi:hypothetical protein
MFAVAWALRRKLVVTIFDCHYLDVRVATIVRITLIAAPLSL